MTERFLREKMILALVAVGLPSFAFAQDAPALPETKRLPAAGTPAFAFRVNTEGLILDTQGTPVLPADIPAQLKAEGVAPGTVLVLLIESTDSMKKMTATVKAFGSSYTKIIIKHYEPADKVGAYILPPPSKADLQREIAAAYPGRPLAPVDASTDVAAMLTERVEALRPGPIPPGVHYRYAQNAAVSEATDRLSRHLAAKTTSAAAIPFWANAVIVQAGIWPLFRDDPEVGHVGALRFHALLPTPGGPRQFDQALLRASRELAAVEEKLRNLANSGGPPRIRALRSEEMKQWWPNISYDICEPILVVESGDGAHRLIFGFTDRGVGMVDALAAP